MSGQFIGVGVGPGDPELITLKADRLIRSADVICYLINDKKESQAKSIAADVLAKVEKEQKHIPILMLMDTNRLSANIAYDQAAEEIQQCLSDNQNVVFLCEGDPLFYGSFAYLLERLKLNPDTQCIAVPGISSFHAASSALCMPLTALSESFCVVNGRRSDAFLIQTLNTYDSVVIMKAGRSRHKILSAIQSAGRSDEAHYLEYIGRENQYIENDLKKLEPEAGPYFSMFVVMRKDRKLI